MSGAANSGLSSSPGADGAAARTPAGRLPTGTVTFLFTDIEGSTRLAAALGDAFAGLVDRHHAILRDAITGHGGLVVATEGDAFFAVFPSATDAAAATMAAQRALAAGPWPAGAEVRVRMGLHTGEGRLGGDSYAGYDVNRAARIAAAGHGGQVVLSAATAALLGAAPGAEIRLRDLGEHQLKDVAVPERLAQLVVDGLPVDFPPLRTLGAPGRLPEPATTFVGRGEEIGEASALLERARLVTLTGPGGTGKTRLSIEVGRAVRARFPGGVWFVELEPVRDPALVVPTAATVVGVPEEPGRPAHESLAAWIGSRELLIILDNFEHVVAAAGDVARLLQAAPAMRVLATSREILRLPGEQEFAVPPLEVDPAVALFRERARLVVPGFDADGSARTTIAAICDRLDSLPLGIELAAARIRLFSPEQLLARLSSRLSLAVGDRRGLSARQRTLRGAIDWSHELLAPGEQAFLRRIAVFAGSPPIEAIEAIVDPERTLGGDPLEVVASLTEKSLLRRIDAGSSVRFGMLQTIREYALERLAVDPGAGAVRERHAAYHLALASRLEPEFVGAVPEQALDEAESAHDDLRAAIAWSIEAGRPWIGLRIAAALWRFYQQRGHLTEGRATLETLLACDAAAEDPEGRARALTALGGVTYWHGDFTGALEHYEGALAAYEAIAHEPGIANALYDLASVLGIVGDIEAARARLDDAAARYARLGDEAGAATTNEARAMQAMLSGAMEEARDRQEEAVAAFRRLDSVFKVRDGLSLLALIRIRLGDLDGARAALREAVALSARVGDLSALGVVGEFGAFLAIAEGRPADAARYVGALVAQSERGERFLRPSATLAIPDPELDARAALDPAAFAAAYGEGRGWTVEDVVARLTADLAT